MPVTVSSGQSDSIWIVLWVTVLLSGCSNVSEQDRAAIDSALSDSTEYVSESWGVTMELLQEGQRFVHITSPFAVSTEQSTLSTTVLYGPVFIEVRDKSGKPETYVSAGRAVYRSRKSEFYLDGGVHVETADQKTLRTESLTWFQFDRMILATGEVTIITPTDSIQGTGLHGDDRLITYTLQSVSGTFTIDAKERAVP